MRIMDWIILVFTGLSFMVSLFTLYLAHLRGPNIKFVIPTSQYHVEGVSGEGGQHNLHIKLLIANLGIRAGVLYEVDFSSRDHAFHSVELEIRQGGPLPKVLSPGDGWHGGAIVIFMLNSIDEWHDYINQQDKATITIKYAHSSTFRSRVVSQNNINIDLSYIRDRINKSNT
ncbi:MAG: hypothetical protein M5U05_12340 [Anaerolineales bacterium]|jgi:hypothetical protein|nr:hypothetical protein [Anaerolineales bacterium]